MSSKPSERGFARRQPMRHVIQRLLGDPSFGLRKQPRIQLAAQLGEEGLVVEPVTRHGGRVLLDKKQRFERMFDLAPARKEMAQKGNAAQRVRRAFTLLTGAERLLQGPFCRRQLIHLQIGGGKPIEIGRNPPFFAHVARHGETTLIIVK